MKNTSNERELKALESLKHLNGSEESVTSVPADRPVVTLNLDELDASLEKEFASKIDRIEEKEQNKQQGKDLMKARKQLLDNPIRAEFRDCVTRSRQLREDYRNALSAAIKAACDARRDDIEKFSKAGIPDYEAKVTAWAQTRVQEQLGHMLEEADKLDARRKELGPKVYELEKKAEELCTRADGFFTAMRDIEKELA